jgi:alpha-tubulin suppressor-like RCC1 family protein
MPNGRAKYFPDHSIALSDNNSGNPKDAPLDNITTVGLSFGGDDQADMGWKFKSRSKTVPTFYTATIDGAVYAWGNDRLGALGDAKPLNLANPTLPITDQPQKVLGLPPVTHVVGRESGAFALDVKGEVWGWGGVDAPQSLLPKDGNKGVSIPAVIKDFKEPIAQISWGCGTAFVQL